jgi:hypothetical protein
MENICDEFLRAQYQVNEDGGAGTAPAGGQASPAAKTG